jgi:AmmeMemoRadiSam system protein A
VRYRSGTSAGVNGDRKSVVGYVAMGIMPGRLSDKQKRQLHELAVTTVTRHVTGRPLPSSDSADPLLRADGATFVTLNDASGRLRGCIGTIQPQMSLYGSVISNAVSAASRDSRFPPVRADELASLRVEVTILSPLEAVKDPGSIVVGRHGVYLEKEGRSSVFLPQVPVEQGWDLPTYLSQLALKAGLPSDGWKGARLSLFTAEVIR